MIYNKTSYKYKQNYILSKTIPYFKGIILSLNVPD